MTTIAPLKTLHHCERNALMRRPFFFFTDIKLILDFIPNHSSVHHEFFLKSKKVVAGTPDSDEDLKYQDFYTWADAPEPNNWVRS